MTPHHKRLAALLSREFGRWPDARAECVAWLAKHRSWEPDEAKRWFRGYVPDAGRFCNSDGLGYELHIVEVAGSSPITKSRLQIVSDAAFDLDCESLVTVLHIVPVFGPVTSVNVSGLWAEDVRGGDLSAYLWHQDMAYLGSYVRSAHREIVGILDRERFAQAIA